MSVLEQNEEHRILEPEGPLEITTSTLPHFSDEKIE